MQEKSFEELRAELEQIVEQLESGEISLEDSVALFEKGVGLTRQCAKILDDAQQKVTMLVRTPSGEVKEENFAGEQNGAAG